LATVRETQNGNIEIVFFGENKNDINNIIISKETAKKVVELFSKCDKKIKNIK